MKDVWTTLSEAEKPIVLYGTGDGADKLLDRMSLFGIKPAAVFASDGFVRDRVFRGFKVKSYAECVKEYGDFTVVVAFGSSLPEVMGNIDRINRERELYMPDLPVAGGEFFDAGFYEKHKSELDASRELFYDERSRKLFDDIVSYKLTGRIDYLGYDSSDTSDIMNELLHPQKYRLALDLGAYNGDTVLELMSYAPSLTKVIALEPDFHSFSKLVANTMNTGIVEVHKYAAWNCAATLPFERKGSRGSALKTGGSSKNDETEKIRAVQCDRILGGKRVDYIKADVEGAEYEALSGLAQTLRAFTPELKISAYHRSDDLCRLPALIKRLNPDYRLFLRRKRCYPAWELDIIAQKDD